MDETVSLTDFTLDDFRIELVNFIETNHNRLTKAPFGLYAVVPSPSGQHARLLEAGRFIGNEKKRSGYDWIYNAVEKSGG